MFEKDQIVLVDTNVILEAHRISCWNNLAHHFKLSTVEKVIEETQTGFQNRQPGQTINEAALRDSLHHIAGITNEARAQFALDHPHVLLDPGELDLIIYAHTIDPKTAWLLNSPDMAAVRYSHQNGWIDRLVSLEAMNNYLRAHTTTNLRENYTDNWLRVKKTRLILNM